MAGAMLWRRINWDPGAEPRRRKIVVQGQSFRGTDPMLGTILIIVLILLLLGAWPSWPYSRGWGYYPSGLLGVVLIVILILVLMGRF